MTHHEKELLVWRIISGSLKWGNYLIKYPSPENMYLAQEFFLSCLSESEGLTNQESEEYVQSEGLWKENDKLQFERIPAEIEEFKVQIYKAINVRDFEKAEVWRKYLKTAQDKYKELLNKKNTYFGHTAEGIASILKNKYIIATSICRNGKCVIKGLHEFEIADEEWINEACVYYNKNKITERQIREIARTEPWRSMWITAKTEKSLFGKASVKYTEEQRALSVWSGIYDSIYQHPEKPNENIINDDDCLDGWMILQRRGDAHDVTNEKIRGMDSILVPASSLTHAVNIDRMNGNKSAKDKEARLYGTDELSQKRKER